MTCPVDRAKITIGEDATIFVDLIDEATGKAFNLTDYVSGEARFCNCAGDTITIALTLPGANPIAGEIIFDVAAAESLLFDQKSKDFDLEIVDNGGKKKIIPMTNKLEIIEPNC